MNTAARLACTGLVVACTACSPAFNWREVRPAGTGALALFPCKPLVQTRSVPLIDRAVDLTLHSCKAGETTFALAHADVGDPARVAQALVALGEAAASNVKARNVVGQAWSVPGMTPNPQARRFDLTGEAPGGGVVDEHVVVFAKGTRVFQATVLGLSNDPQAVAAFVDGLRFPP
jgi:hypothetical protein